MNPEPESANFPFWKTLWNYFQPWRWHLVGAISLNLIVGFAITIETAIPKYLTDNVLMGHQETGRKAWLAAVILLVYLGDVLILRMGLYFVGSRIFNLASQQMLSRLRSRFFSHINYLCLRFHARKNSGELFSYLFGAPLTAIVNYLGFVTNTVPYSIFTLAGTLALVGSWNLSMTAVLSVCLLGNIILSVRAGKKIKNFQRDYQQFESTLSGETADLLRGTRFIKMMGLEEKVSKEFSQKAEQLGRRAFWLSMTNSIEGIKVEGLGYLFYAILAYMGSLLYLKSRLTIGELLGFLSAFTLLRGPLNSIFQASVLQGAAHAGLNRIETVFHEQTTTPDPPASQRPVLPARPAVTFDDVSFAYEDRPTLSHVSFTIPYGQKVALVGPSGAGKSTVSAMMLRLYDPNEGSIRLDDQDLRHFHHNAVRRQFGVVPQEPFLFNATLRENIRAARPQATDAELETALRGAAAWSFIDELPKKLDTMVGEGGFSLSGGQRQRIAIARAILLDPPIFIFDEATSALDTVSERLIQETMEKVFEGRTALIVAHRLSTIRFVDPILVFEQGRIVQDGTYRELSAAPGLFSQLLKTQYSQAPA
jgi:ABC-type multidrug transport system fused ATPase/permease subunit